MQNVHAFVPASASAYVEYRSKSVPRTLSALNQLQHMYSYGLKAEPAL